MGNESAKSLLVQNHRALVSQFGGTWHWGAVDFAALSGDEPTMEDDPLQDYGPQEVIFLQVEKVLLTTLPGINQTILSPDRSEAYRVARKPSTRPDWPFVEIVGVKASSPEEVAGA